MEVTSFVLGMLAIVVLTMLIATVVGMVRITKLEKQINSLQQVISTIEVELSREIQETWNRTSRLLEETCRDITMVERTIMQRIDQEMDGAHRHIDQEVQAIHQHEDQLHREIEQAKSYTDSRIDKLVVLTGTIKGSKEVLKG
jgi:hypothetical protein